MGFWMIRGLQGHDRLDSFEAMEYFAKNFDAARREIAGEDDGAKPKSQYPGSAGMRNGAMYYECKKDDDLYKRLWPEFDSRLMPRCP